MPKLSRYTGNVNAVSSNDLGGRINPNIVQRSRMGDALMDAGMNILKMEEAEREADRYASKSEKTKQLALDLNNLEHEAKNTDDPEQWFNDRSDTIRQRIYGDIDDTKLRRDLDDNYNQLTLGNITRLRSGNRQKVIDRSVAALNDTYDTMKNLFDNPMSDEQTEQTFTFMDGEVQGAMNKGFISAQEEQRLRSKFRSDAHTLQAQRQLIEDPFVALENLKDDSQYKHMPPAKRLEFIDRAKKRIQIKNNKNATAVMEDAKDKAAQVLHTGDMSGVDETYTKIEALKDKETADRWKADIDLSKKGYDVFKDAMDDTPADAIKKIEDLKPTPGQANYADAYKVYDTAQKNYSKFLKDLDKDPAGTVAKHHSLTDPREVMEAQKIMGIPEHKRSWFSEKQAKDIVAGFEANDSVETTLKELNSMFDADKENFRFMFKDLVDAGLDQNVMVLMNMNAAPQFQKNAIRAFGVGQKELEKSLTEMPNGANEKKVIRQNIKAKLEDFRVSFTGTVSRGFSAANDAKWQVYDQIEDALYTTALYNRVVDGQSLSKSVEDTATLFAGQYKFNNGYRVPSEYDIDRVDTYADFMTKGLQDMDLVMFRDGELNTPTEKANYIQAIEENGTWITNEDETGLILLNHVREPVFHTVDGEPVRVEFKFDTAEMDYPEIKDQVKRPWYSFGG